MIQLPAGIAALDLPVAKRAHEIDFAKKYMVVRAATGAGKSIVVPPVEAALRRASGAVGCIAMRCPTKITGGFLAQSLRQFWPDLKIAALNRDVLPDSPEETRCKDADIVIISDGSLARLMNLATVAVYYADEAHWPSLLMEIELAIAKRNGLPIRLLSATIDEKPFLEYLPDAASYFLEGRTFPIEKRTIWGGTKVFDRKDGAELRRHISESIRGLKADAKSGLWFLPTRQMCEDMAEAFAKAIPTFFIHGGVSPWDAEAWTKKHAGQPFVVFCTTAAATGITISVDRSYVADDLVESIVERGLEHTTSGPMGDNMWLQAAGRVGRIRPGEAFLLTHPGIRNADSDLNPAASMSPKPVVPPSEKSTPFDVILAMAQHGVTDDAGLDLLGKPNPEELSYARQWLQRNGCLTAEGTLTTLGKRIAAFPMATQHAHCILTAPSVHAQIVLHAAFALGLQGTYGLVRAKPRSRELMLARMKNRNFQILPPECIVQDSGPLTLAAIVREVVKLEEPTKIYKWADANNMWAKSLLVARKDFVEGSKAIHGSAKRAFMAMSMADQNLRTEVHTHLRNHPLFSPISFRGGGGARPPIDAVFVDAFELGKGDPRFYEGWGIRKRIVKPDMQFTVYEMSFEEEVQDG